MTSIERTAYPRFSQRQQFNKQWLYENFSLQDEDYEVLHRKRAIDDSHKLCMTIQLKVFQYLGYFPDLKEVPGKTNANIKNALFVGSTAELQKMLNKKIK